MKRPQMSKAETPSRFNLAFIAIIALFVLVVGLRWYLGERSLDDVGYRAWVDTGYAIVLLIVVAIAAYGVGMVVLELIGLPGGTKLEAGLISLALGFGIIAYGVLVLGLSGFLMPLVVLGWRAMHTGYRPFPVDGHGHAGPI